MVRAGLLGLEFFSPETGSWKQVCSFLHETQSETKLIVWILIHDKVFEEVCI